MITLKPRSELPVDYKVSLRNVLGITLFTVLVAVLLGVIVVQLDHSIGAADGDPIKKVLWIFLILLTGVLTATGYVLAWRTPLRWGIIGLTPPEPRWVLISVAVGAVLFFLGERADHVLRLGILENFRAQFGTGLKSQVGLLSMLAVFGLLRPIALEVYFRGVLLNYFVNRIGAEAGLFVTSLLFAGLYFQPDLPANMAYGFVYALAFGLLFLRSGSLWNAVVAHATVGVLFVAKVAWT
jgi:membrane protease YdiL (CAAX protease family)